jgi:hypothetical protein
MHIIIYYGEYATIKKGYLSIALLEKIQIPN